MALNENTDGSQGAQRLKQSLALKLNTDGAQNAEYSNQLRAHVRPLTDDRPLLEFQMVTTERQTWEETDQFRRMREGAVRRMACWRPLPA